MFDLTLAVVPRVLVSLRTCGELAGLLTGAPSARLSGENMGPLTGVVGADSDCLLAKISSANHTLRFPFGGVPEVNMHYINISCL